jgi:hypothetical protein
MDTFLRSTLLKHHITRVALASLVSFSTIRAFFEAQINRFSPGTIVHIILFSFPLETPSPFLLLILLLFPSPGKSSYCQAHVPFYKLNKAFFNRLDHFYPV